MSGPDLRSHRTAALIEDAVWLMQRGAAWDEVVRRTGAAPAQLVKYLDVHRPGWRVEFNTSPSKC